MTRNLENIIIKFKYILLFLYILFIYIFGEKLNYTYTFKIPMLIFSILEIIKIIKSNKIKVNPVIYSLIIFFVYSLLSYFWAINPELVIPRALTLMQLTIFLLLVYNFLSKIENGCNVLLKIIFLSGVCFSIYVINFYGISKYFNLLISGARIGAEIDNVNQIGLECAITYLVALYFGKDGKKKYYVFGIIPLIVALGSGSRKVLVFIILGTLLNIMSDVNLKTFLKKVLILALIGIIGIYFLNDFGEISIFERFESMMNIFSNDTRKVDSSTLERTKFIKYGLEQFKQTPFLGIGIANSGYVTMKAAGWFTYLHNNYVELLATLGIIGFGLYYFNYIYLIKEIINTPKNNLKSFILILYFIILVLDMGVVSYYSKSTYIYLLIGILYLDKIKDNKDRGKEKYE